LSTSLAPTAVIYPNSGKYIARQVGKDDKMNFKEFVNVVYQGMSKKEKEVFERKGQRRRERRRDRRNVGKTLRELKKLCDFARESNDGTILLSERFSRSQVGYCLKQLFPPGCRSKPSSIARRIEDEYRQFGEQYFVLSVANPHTKQLQFSIVSTY
jgi:hypothetical protein